MSDFLKTTSTPMESSLALTVPLPLTRHPAHVYITSLGQGSRQTMRGSLNAIASMLTAGTCDAMTLDWAKLRYQHTAAVRGVTLRRLTSQAVLFILQKRGEEAGVAAFSTHDFRRTFISDLLDAGVDLVTVQRLAGHSDPSTSSRYDRRPEAVKRRAVELLDLPGLSE